MRYLSSHKKFYLANSKSGQSCPLNSGRPPGTQQHQKQKFPYVLPNSNADKGVPDNPILFIFRGLIILSLFFIQTGWAQTTITGTVTDEKGEPIPDANVYLQNTYDGASTDTLGNYTFITEEKGEQTLVVSAVGFKKFAKPVLLSGKDVAVAVRLKESIDKMEGVVINAGAFEASDRHKAVVLKPMDIVSTAGALGDVIGAINTLPGTQTVGESGRLFIRGGESYETKVFIDGTLVQQPYNSSIPNVPTRGRYSPFLFKGTTFSTGGYSAEYGQALSSALILDTKDFPNQTQTDISLMTIGADITHQQLWENISVLLKAEYSNLLPYMALVSQDFDWEKAPESAGTALVFRQKTSKTGLLKFYTNYTYNRFALNQPDIDHLTLKDSLDLGNDNFYLNSSYREALGKKWTMEAGLSYTNNKINLTINQSQVNEKDEGIHTKLTFAYDASERVAIRMGSEYFHQSYQESYKEIPDFFRRSFENNLAAGFVEADVYLSNKLIARTGARFEYADLLGAANLAPRLSLAYKTGRHSQASLAYGEFYQTPENDFLKLTQELTFEHARHWIANYQLMKNDRIFRIEAYWKKIYRSDSFCGAFGNPNLQQ